MKICDLFEQTGQSSEAFVHFKMLFHLDRRIAQDHLAGRYFFHYLGGTSGDDEDFFMLTLTGFEDVNLGGGSTGAIDVFLADYRFSDNSKDYILDSWNQVDLTSLGSARSVEFSFTTTDNSAFGPNTPLFVAIDNLSYSINSVPEPTAPLLLSVWALALVARRSRKLNTLNSD